MPTPPLTRWPLVAAVVAAGFALELAIWDGTTGTRWGAAAPAPVVVLVVLLGLGASALAWWWPAPGFLVAAGACLALGIAVPAWESFVAILLALFVLARRVAPAVSLPGLGVAAAALGLNAWNSAGWAGPRTVDALLPLLALWVGIAAITWAVGHAMRRGAERVVALERSLAEAHRMARINERRAIARDLHDIVAHSVAGILLQAGGARALTAVDAPATGSTQSRVALALGHIEGSAHQAMRELHRLLVTLRDPDTPEPEGERRGGLADLDALADHARASGLSVAVTVAGTPEPLDRSVDLAVYRCLQEGFANAMKHAGAGSTLGVDLAWGEDLVITLTSVPRAGRVPARTRLPGGLGLVGLSERLASVGGQLDAGPGGQGFTTVARIPLA